LTPVRVSVPVPFFQRPPLPPMAPETVVLAVVLKTPPVPLSATLWPMAVPLARIVPPLSSVRRLPLRPLLVPAL